MGLELIENIRISRECQYGGKYILSLSKILQNAGVAMLH